MGDVAPAPRGLRPDLLAPTQSAQIQTLNADTSMRKRSPLRRRSTVDLGRLAALRAGVGAADLGALPRQTRPLHLERERRSNSLRFVKSCPVLQEASQGGGMPAFRFLQVAALATVRLRRRALADPGEPELQLCELKQAPQR